MDLCEILSNGRAFADEGGDMSGYSTYSILRTIISVWLLFATCGAQSTKMMPVQAQISLIT